MKPYLAQAKAEIRLTLSQGESLLVTLGIPVILLVALDLIRVLPTGTASPIAFLAPGMLSLAIMSTGLVSLAIGTAFERSYGVLKRLGTTPLGRVALLGAKITSVATVELLQAVVIVVVALLLGWHPRGDILPAVLAVVLGTSAFAGLGLFLAGTLKAELVLGLSNGVYLVLLLVGGMVFPLSKLPGPMGTAARLLPSGALSQALLHSLGVGGGVPVVAWWVLAFWALAAPILAAATFRWD